MTETVRIVMAQLNFLVGDVAGNAQSIINAAQEAKQRLQADLIVFPELALTGYPPEDLLLRSDLHEQIKTSLGTIQQSVQDIDMLIGTPLLTDSGLYNGAVYIRSGEIIANYHKQHLPNYGVFDEKRYFISGNESCVIEHKGIKLSILICEDLWQTGPCRNAVQQGADLIISINASPYDMRKASQREQLVADHAQKYSMPIMYVHCLGGQDELIFDGGSFVTNAQGQVCQQAPYFEDCLVPVDINVKDISQFASTSMPKPLADIEHIYKALVLAVKDYIGKNGFKGAVLGLSGGIDSALSLTIAVDAIGAANVEAIMMPSRYTADISAIDAQQLIDNLGVEHRTISIEPSFKCFLELLSDEFADLPVDVTEQNIQARCRGLILMAISNKKGKIVLTTGNKSEMAMGYATLYGDMAGGFAVLKDVPKTLVYRLSQYRNSIKADIPQRILDRPPTAELAPDQKDEDNLPPYDILDEILKRYIELDYSISQIVADGFDKHTVQHVVTMVDKNEYKRRQAPPGARITTRAFGRERRYPITSGFKPIA